jgi:tRNA G18 (ribose-2'-O)-methylase SpoU
MSNNQGRLVDIFVENSLYQHLEVLKRNREKRQRYREIFVEGVTSINALMQTGHRVTSIAYSRDKELSGWAKSVIKDADPPQIYRLTGELMSKLSDRTDPSELIVTVQPNEYSLDDIPLSPSLFAVVFERPSNHGNLGSLIRSCDAFGVDALITTGHGVDPYDPAVIRASLGVIFHTHIIHVPSSTALEQWIAHVREVVPGVQLVGTRAEATLSIFEMTMTPPLILALGNEAQGMGRRLEQLADVTVSIPMQGHADSLNVACAGSILLYQTKRNMWIEKGP